MVLKKFYIFFLFAILSSTARSADEQKGAQFQLEEDFQNVFIDMISTNGLTQHDWNHFISLNFAEGCVDMFLEDRIKHINNSILQVLSWPFSEDAVIHQRYRSYLLSWNAWLKKYKQVEDNFDDFLRYIKNEQNFNFFFASDFK